jgi:fucose 4-O-acetylase-like acetyltransferase
MVATTTRRSDLDRLRILAVLLLFPFHSARVFNPGSDFYVRNAQESPGLGWTVVTFLDPWHMGLLFVLAGMASWFAFGHRSPRQYAGERTRRLLVPFLFGLLAIVPLQQYLAVQRVAGSDHSLGGWLTDYWGMRGEIGGYTGGFTFGHLWFVI